MRIHAISGVLALVSIHAACLAPPKEPEIAAFLTTERVVYPFGSPVDLTFSIAVPQEGSVSPDFKIERETGSGDEDGKPGLPETIEPREVAGRFFWETPGKAIDGTERPGSIPAGRQLTETIVDLRQWYGLDSPGTYRITFDGQWLASPRPRGEGPTPGAGARAPRKGEVESHPVTSNTLLIRIARPASDEEPLGEPIQGRVIPLEDIWALDMPGTKPMRTAVAAAPGGDIDVAPEGTMVREILLAINKSEWPPRDAPPGFAVRGTGMDALREAHAVLVAGQEPPTRFRQGEQISLVFFSKNLGRYLHLNRVEQNDSTVQISYKLIVHESGEVTSHLALIPLTVPAAGEVRIEIRPLIDWTEQNIPPPNLEHLAHRVCHPFAFEIRR